MNNYKNKNQYGLIKELNSNSIVADIGCFGWKLYDQCNASQVCYIGVDRVEPPGRPINTKFANMNNKEVKLADKSVDLCIASNVIEHIDNPVELMAELCRILKPGGIIMVDTPSELSCVPIASNDPEDHDFINFWDDPTHVRPHTPASLYRLAISTCLFPLWCGRVNESGIPSSRVIAKRPESLIEQITKSRYVSFEGVKPGVESAWEFVWPEVKIK